MFAFARGLFVGEREMKVSITFACAATGKTHVSVVGEQDIKMSAGKWSAIPGASIQGWGLVIPVCGGTWIASPSSM